MRLSSGARKGSGSFLNTDEIVDLLFTPETATNYLCSELPKGIKENVYFVVDNGENISRRNCREKSVFPDDCGAWSESSSTNKHHYIYEHGLPVYTELKNTLFTKYSGGQKLPINPQPKMDDILILKRYYTTLKMAPDYKKTHHMGRKIPSESTKP